MRSFECGMRNDLSFPRPSYPMLHTSYLTLPRPFGLVNFKCLWPGFFATILIPLTVLLFQCACAAKANPKDVQMFDNNPPILKILNFNVWHGLNPTSILRFGQYESANQRELRYASFLAQARAFDPDVLFLQEVNPAPSMSRRIAKDLGLDAVWQIDNSGVKLGSVGLPSNLRSGLTTLARKGLDLKKVGAKKLSGPRGLCNDWLTWQFDEFRYLLAATITVKGREILLLNTHLHHGPEVTPQARQAMDSLVKEGVITKERAGEILGVIGKASDRRRRELETAMNYVKSLGRGSAPTIFAGDFNASPDAAELLWLKSDLGFQSMTKGESEGDFFFTWNWARNENTHQIDSFVPVNSFAEARVNHEIHDLEIGLSRRIDYIFHRNAGGVFKVQDSGIFGDALQGGRMASDHFGIWAKLLLMNNE
jgi:endonuclease/exonuclease/phosphatase family metal-dependent hydrolase